MGESQHSVLRIGPHSLTNQDKEEGAETVFSGGGGGGTEYQEPHRRVRVKYVCAQLQC